MSSWSKDFFSGITVGIVALPMALAFGIASGAGAAAGLYTSIVAGLLAAFCGGSRFQITGPTGAMTAVLTATVAQYGVQGMLLAGFGAGLIQITLGLFKLGRIVKLIPYGVVAGFTNGIAVVIFIGQLSTLKASPWVALVTIAAIAASRRFAPKLPSSLVGLVVGTGFHWLAGQAGPIVPVLPTALPTVALPQMNLTLLKGVAKPALEIALLGCIETLLSATVADSMTKTSHDSDRELIGQGIGNVASALVGGLPASGVMARTAVNVKSGGQTRWVSIVQSLLLISIMLFLGPITGRIPLAALAGILVVTCYNMIDWQSLQMTRTAPRSFGAVLLLTAVITVLANAAVAVMVGILLTTVVHTHQGGRLHLHEIKDPRLSGEVKAYVVDGPIFFGNAEKVHQVAAIPAKAVLLDLGRLHHLDVSGTLALKKLAERLHDEGKQLLFYGTAAEKRQLLEDVAEAEFAQRHLAESLEHALQLVAS